MPDWMDSFADPTQQDILRAQIQALRQRNNPQDLTKQSQQGMLLSATRNSGLQNLGQNMLGDVKTRESETQPRLMGALKSIQEGPQKALGGQTPETFKLLTQREQVPKFMPVPPGYGMGNQRTGQVKPGSVDGTDPIASNVEGIINGTLPPDLKGNNRMGPLIKAGLRDRGFDLAKAQNEWTATQHHLSTLNGQQQERLRQAVEFTSHSLDNIEQLYGQWKQAGTASGVRLFNKASLAASKQLPGPAGASAQALEAAIADSVAEMANVYMGGNSPTDQAIKLASHNLAADWNEETFTKALNLARTNLKMRKNAMLGTTSAGVGGSRYDQTAPQQAAAAPQAAPQTAPGPRPRRTANGETREWDGKAWVPVGH